MPMISPDPAQKRIDGDTRTHCKCQIGRVIFIRIRLNSTIVTAIIGFLTAWIRRKMSAGHTQAVKRRQSKSSAQRIIDLSGSTRPPLPSQSREEALLLTPHRPPAPGPLEGVGNHSFTLRFVKSARETTIEGSVSRRRIVAPPPPRLALS